MTPDPGTRRPIVVAGAIASKLHNGGEAWVRMSWLDAVRCVGRDAWLVEQIDRPSPAHIAYFRDVVDWFGVADRSLLVDGRGNAVVGPAGVDPRDVADSAEALLNISGHLAGTTLFERFSHRVMVDIDPGYTQIWHARGLEGANVDGHHAYSTIGENIGADDCAIPTNGVPWIPTRQPVSLTEWATPASSPPTTSPSPAASPSPVRFSTVAAWRGSYGAVEFDGRRYGVKAHEFRRFLDLPSRCRGATFEIALDIHADDDADRRDLVDAGWSLTDPVEASSTPDRFRRYVQGSSGELSVAQGVYVHTRSGWFSDRTTRYLAAGRPAVVQDTGFTRVIESGDGLLAFTDAAGAADAVAEVRSNYAHHAAAARSVAERYFDPRTIVTRLFDEVL